MDPSTMPRCEPDKRHDAGNTLFDVAPWEPAFENLVTAMRGEFLRAIAAIDQLRLENNILRGKIGSCTGTVAHDVKNIEAYVGPSGKVTGLVPGHHLSDEGPPTTPSPTSPAWCSRTSLAQSDIAVNSDWQARVTGTEKEPERVWDSEDTAPTQRQPIVPSSSVSLSAASSAGADKGKLQDVLCVGPHPAEARVDLRLDRSSSLLGLAPGTEGKVFGKGNIGDMDGPAGRRHSFDSAGSALSVLSVWEKEPKLLHRSLGRRRLIHEPSMPLGVRAGDELTEDSVFQRFVLHPWRFEAWVWDTSVSIVAAYDLIMVPLQVFSMTHVATDALDLITACVWTLDVVAGFFRGRDISGVVDMRPSAIAKSYLQKWFVLDFAFVAMDWVFIVASTIDLNVVRSIRVRRVLRFLHVMRVLRITRPLQRVQRMQGTSDYAAAFSSVIKFLFAMWLVNHYVACGWYAIADIGIEPNWIANTFDESDSIQFRYTTAYHWSLTQFTPASMEVVPTNAVERAYSVGAIFFGLVMFTSFVSHMTNAVARIQRLTADTDMQRRDLRRYLQCHQVTLELGQKIEAFVKTANKRMKSMRLLESDVTVLRMLPEDLLRKLREDVRAPVLCVHPFFEKFQGAESSAFMSICNLAAAEKNVLIGEELFRRGQTATKMYFSTAGDLSYYFEDIDGYIVEDVPEGSWFSEAALWCNWKHRGRMMSSDDLAELVMVNATEFHTIVAATVSIRQVQRYAKMYALLGVDECGRKEFITDTWGGTSSVAMAVRYAWAACVHCSSWPGSREWYVNAFHAWKLHTRSRERPVAKSRVTLSETMIRVAGHHDLFLDSYEHE